ncbi:hypothetical protein [Ectopseudomonas alcaliphila]|uniref:Uncharacterized protein n=1 Tax=Ectopseudomonas alcaliphila TaxID=101564 RepID=A0ABU4Q298_9GAMM|nr:hypothetical protein [Pseudomonas alcaliphila]MDX5993948.1 hypothetical protein [Pseudomonas alcaliphila]
MKNKLSSKEKELWNRISKILWKNWDPIGVYEEDSEWDDEYDSYVPHIFRLAVEGCDHIRIAASLTSTIRQNIGLSATGNSEHDISVAKLIVSARQEILD